jgi:putative peptidoglycan lipid II flippase
LGFSFRSKISFDTNVRKIGRLAAPRMLEVVFSQISKTVELYFSSIVSTASYTFYTFGNSLQLLPVGLFGTSIAKAALPTLAQEADDSEKFEYTLMKALKEMVFVIAPVATVLIVLRIPVVRLVYGTDIFTWEATVQTSLVLSAFAFGVVFQAANSLLARGFYALHNTKTPVSVSISAIILIIILDWIFIRVFHTQVWGLAAAFSIGSFLQAAVLFVLIEKRINGGFKLSRLLPFSKFLFSSLVSGTLMFVLLKFFDRSVWVKKLSFLTAIEATKYLPFEKFVLDTRYTVNLLILTAVTSFIGIVCYLVISYLLRTKELFTFASLIKRIILKKSVGAIPEKERETISPRPTEVES